MALEPESYLVVRSDGGRHAVIPLAAEAVRLTIGRGEGNDVALPWDERVSRLHAELQRVVDEWVLIDDGLSRNGTFVGAARLAGRRRLRHGDRIQVGDTTIVFYAPADAVGGTSTDPDGAGKHHVSPGQRRVLVALCRPALTSGAYGVPPTNAELAAELFLSVDAIKSHLRALFDAFELGSVPASQKRAALVERALSAGVVSKRDLEG
jgi:hypothetical protein